MTALVGVAFVTLYERKILGLAQARLGPSKSGVWGVLQPGADAIKLFLKSNNLPLQTHYSLFTWAPLLALRLALLLWRISPAASPNARGTFALPFFLMLLRLNVYPLIFIGWASKNNFTSLGALRGVAQSISYEIGLAFILITLSLLRGTLRMHKVLYLLKRPPTITAVGLFLLWGVVILAETNRAPFDFAEGERELVSGFNTEYGGGGLR